MTVIITGCSTGIGRATAIAAARAGFPVVATVRRPCPELDAAGVPLDVRELELTDPASVAALVAGVVDTYGGIDALVNNAGIANSSPTLEFADLDAIRHTLEVNFFGVLALSRAVMPHLRAAGGRLITVGSVRGVIGQPFNESYSAAKFAVEGFMEALAPVAARVGVTVTMVEPAAVLDTSFVASSTLDPETVLATAGPYEPAFRAYRDWVASGAVASAQTAAEVADVIVGVLTAEKPPFRVHTSEYARDYVATKLADPDGTAVAAMTGSWVGGAVTV
jgi:NAD(P)-dependent dehydrogenase (short-subunit alcohol dehydrogenase family)